LAIKFGAEWVKMKDEGYRREKRVKVKGDEAQGARHKEQG
jgi:hypothetical protein